ncbi:hypothetical protein PV326_012655 [Microctonus aethiopoides]|nr:hypothetical protein PV326_012655 [Microctonus aethiopoides]
MRGFRDFPSSQIDASSDPYTITNSDSSKVKLVPKGTSEYQAQSDAQNSDKEDMDDIVKLQMMTIDMMIKWTKLNALQKRHLVVNRLLQPLRRYSHSNPNTY